MEPALRFAARPVAPRVGWAKRLCENRLRGRGKILLLISIALVIFHMLPFAGAVWLWRSDCRSRIEWALQSALVWAGSLFLYLVGGWGLVGYPFRYAVIVCVGVATVLSWRKTHRLPVNPSGGGEQAFVLGVYAAAAIGAATLLMLAWRGRQHDPPAVDLLFPLAHGTYFVAQGGSSRVLNKHRTVRLQQYALDIDKLNRLGMTAVGLLPADVSKYAIFGASVVSPCNGDVVEMVDGLPDLAPPRTDRENTKGNYILLRCRSLNVDVLLAHLQQGSLRSRIGEAIPVGRPIGRVGNSGNTSQPHLHVQATRNDEAVPMTFAGRFLVRNDLVRSQ
jgi:Peptidase family M23